MSTNNVHIRYIDLFCGIGGFRIAAERTFRRRGLSSQCVWACDKDPDCQEAYDRNFGHRPEGDVTEIKADAVPDHDLLFAGFPCQPFSIIGNGEGFDDARGTLFFDIARILEAKRPRGFVLENVRRLVSLKNGSVMRRIMDTLRNLGYNVDYRILNALDYGLPQKRERVFIVGFHEPIFFVWPPKTADRIPLTDILQKDVDKKYYASEYIRNKRKAEHTPRVTPSIWHENKAGNIGSYPYSCALRAGASHNYLLVNGERRLTPREMLRLQGFPDSFKIAVSEYQTRKQAGNAVPVNLVRAVLESFLPILERDASGRQPSERSRREAFASDKWASGGTRSS